jgi:hypothetical protein
LTRRQESRAGNSGIYWLWLWFGYAWYNGRCTCAKHRPRWSGIYGLCILQAGSRGRGYSGTDGIVVEPTGALRAGVGLLRWLHLWIDRGWILHRFALHRESRSGVLGRCRCITKSNWWGCLLGRGDKIGDFRLPWCTRCTHFSRRICRLRFDLASRCSRRGSIARLAWRLLLFFGIGFSFFAWLAFLGRRLRRRNGSRRSVASAAAGGCGLRCG